MNAEENGKVQMENEYKSFYGSYILGTSILLTLGHVLLYWTSMQMTAEQFLYSIWYFFQPLVKYQGSFEFCTVLFLVVSICAFVRKRNDQKLAVSVLLNFFNTIGCWSYIPDIWKWLKASEKHFLYIIAVLGLILLIYCRVKYRNGFHQCAIFLSQNIKLYPVFWMIFGLLSIFLLLQIIAIVGQLFGFRVSGITEALKQFGAVRLCVSGCSLVYLCFRGIIAVKKGDHLPGVLSFADFGLSIWGLTFLYSYRDILSKYLTVQKAATAVVIAAVCYAFRKLYTAIDWAVIKGWIAAKTKWVAGTLFAAGILAVLGYFNYRFHLIPTFEFSAWALRGIQIFLFAALILIFALVITLLVRCIRFIHKSNWIPQKIGQLISGFFKRDSYVKLTICIGGIVILAIGTALTIILVQWGMGMDFFRDGEEKYISSIGMLASYLCLAIVFVAFCMLVMTEIVLFVMKSLQKIYKNNQQPLHWVLLMVSAVLTYLSIYFYNKSELDDWSSLKIAGNVFGVFAIPVILMAWYVIMTGLIGSLGKILSEQTIKDNLKEEMNQLIPMFINSIFAPFYFLVSFGDDLRSALVESEQLEEESPEQTNGQENNSGQEST